MSYDVECGCVLNHDGNAWIRRCEQHRHVQITASVARAGREDVPVEETPAVLVFPVVGPFGPGWPLTQGRIDEWRALFPDLDVLAQCRAALAWITASPTRRKTAKGMPRFLVGWLTRSNDRGGRIADTRVIARPRGQAPAHVIGEAWRDECRRKHGGTCASKDLCQRRLLSEFQGRKDGKTGEAF